MKMYLVIFSLSVFLMGTSVFAYDENAQINSLKDSQVTAAGATGGPIVTPQQQETINQRQGYQNQNPNAVNNNVNNDGNNLRGNAGQQGPLGGRFGR